MTPHRIASRVSAASGSLQMVFDHFNQYFTRASDPGVADFAYGNPHEMPSHRFVDALRRASLAQDKDWFAYKMNEAPAQAVVAESLRARRGVPFEADDIHMTNGGFGALAVAINTLVEPGDELIFISPPWFFYEATIHAAGGIPVRATIRHDDFDLDLDSIADAISEKTAAVLVNSPNNPTGKIYPPETLNALADLLWDASQRHGRPIYLLSDEAYCRIVFDAREFPSPTTFYPYSLLLYSYGKTLLTPGQRMGYIALPPSMPEREAMREAIFTTQLTTGYAFPNAIMQHGIADLEKLSIDVEHLQTKRDRLVSTLHEVGYELHSPEGTFYLLPRAPIEDDIAFTQILDELDILCLPGSVVEMPGYFRISLTANDEMIERSFAGFAMAVDRARA